VTRVREAVRAAEGTFLFVPRQELWATATLIADTFPLERTARFPREARRVGHCARLVLFDRAITDQERAAVLSVSATNPWGPALVLVGVAGFLARAPRWIRWLSLGTAGAWLATNHRLTRTIALQRELLRVAPDALVVSGFVTREPGRASQWALEMLDALGSQATIATILPGAGDTRRYRARERLYTTRFGFRIATRTRIHDEDFTILVRDRAQHTTSPPTSTPPSTRPEHPFDQT